MLKTNFEFPRGDDPVKQGQRLAQDLSSNFKALTKQIKEIETSIPSSTTVTISQSFVGAIGVTGTSYTLSHNLGKIPTEFQVIDFTTDSAAPQWEIWSISRTSWTDTTITVKLNFYSNWNSNCTFKIRVS